MPINQANTTHTQLSRRPSVLLVEDEESITEPFAHALGRSGFETTVARTGAEALELARTIVPDVLLLDLALPDADGRDICRQLRRESEVPIIMVTASGTLTDRVVGLELGSPARKNVVMKLRSAGSPSTSTLSAAQACPRY